MGLLVLSPVLMPGITLYSSRPAGSACSDGASRHRGRTPSHFRPSAKTAVVPEAVIALVVERGRSIVPTNVVRARSGGREQRQRMVAHVDSLTRLAWRAGAGDAWALEALVESAYEPVWRLCAALVGGQSADDLSQETFFQVVRALPSFRGESSALTWIWPSLATSVWTSSAPAPADAGEMPSWGLARMRRPPTRGRRCDDGRPDQSPRPRPPSGLRADTVTRPLI